MPSRDYESIITILTREILKKRLAIFIGAGCSMAVGFPSWKQLLENLISKYGIQTKEFDSRKLASRIERSIGRSNFVDEISDICRTLKEPTSSTHELLTELDVNLFITTNYDHLLEEAFRKKGIDPHIVLNDLDLANLNPTAKTIVKLHGDIDSPSSMVCTERDYREYKTRHRGFTDWLKAKDAELTILFLGTSFDDPRLVDADDHVIEFFGENKRNHVIVLRKPSSDDQEIDLQAELEDFDDRRRSFESERGILVLSIQRYGEIEELLKEIKNRVQQARIDEKQDLDQNSGLYRLKADLYEKLDKKFAEHLDVTVRELCAEIAGPGYFPSFSKAKEKIDLLIDRLQNPPHRLSPETIVHGYLTLVDSFAATSRPEDNSKALEFCDKAQLAVSALEEGHELGLRLFRAKAKLLFFRGDFQSALETLQDDDTPKGIFWRLSILLASERLDEALLLIRQHDPIQPEWVGEAVRVLILRGDLEEAEDIYNKFVATPDLFQDPLGLTRLHLQTALAYFRRAILLEGNPHPFQTIPGKLSQSADTACRKALHYLDKIYQACQYTDPNESLLFAESLITKMQILDLIGETTLAFGIAKDLLHFRPIPKEVATYIAFRENPDNRESVLALAELLSLDHPLEDWAWVMRTKLLALAGQYEEAWELLYQARAYIHGEEEKKELAWTASELGHSTGKRDAAMALLEELIDREDPFFQFLLAKNLFFQGDFDRAYGFLQNLTKSSLYPSVQAEVLSLMARIKMKRAQWSEAKDLLQQSISKFNHPLNLKALIYVGSKEKDDVIILDAAIKLEQLGFSDDETRQAKAQAAFNLGRYDLAIETWKAIYDKDRSPKTAISLATALRAKGVYDEALNILKQHISHDDTPDLDCLGLYCTILELDGKPEDAFRQLDSSFEDIKDHPNLLALHMNLAYRVNQEDRAHQSMRRLIDLQKMGKVDPSLFRPGNIDEFKEIIEDSKKRREFATEQYRLGRFPRLFLCEVDRRPYYLDWAIRTQEIPDNLRTRMEYTIYSTNNLRVELRGGKRDLIQILAPAEFEEIVIDLSALITLHRLNLFPIIEKQFKAIYYPQAFHWLWELDKPRFAYHQRSKAILYREIDNFITTGKIGRIELPSEQDESIFTYMVKLARKEGMPIITAWSNKEDWKNADKGVVIWLPKIVNWLYKSGRLGEDKYRNCLSLLKGLQGSNDQDVSKTLQSAGRLLFDEGAIEFLVENDLLDPLLSLGVRPALANWTAFYFQQAVREIDFLEIVGKWQQDLEATIKASKVFQPFTQPLRKRKQGYHLGIIEATLKFCKEHGLPLMADDRTMQMISEPGWAGNQFGTDAFLLELFKQDKLTLEQYTRYFVQLVRWRYRFLLPEDHLLLYLAKQYKNRPLGTELIAISDYGRDCMEDVGLFLGPEATDPPKPLGAALYLKWIDQWAKLLCSIWTDEDFDQDSRLGITRKILTQAIPPPPKGLLPEFRERLGGSEEVKVLFAIIQFIMESSKCLELSGLLHEAFSYYGIDKERQANILREHFQSLVRISLSDSFRQGLVSNPAMSKELSKENLTYEGFIKEKILRKNLARILVAYYGSQDIPTPSPFSDLMEEYGMISTLIEKSDTEGIGLPRGHEVPRGDISVSVFDGSIFKIAWPEETKVEFAFCHDMLNHPITRFRMEAFQKIIAMGQLSEPTRMELERWKGSLVSDIKAHWEPAAYRMRQVVMKDFCYSRMHLKTALLHRVPDKEVIFNAVNNLLFPDLDTAWAEAPPLVKSPEQNPEVFRQNIVAEFKEAQKKGGNETENILNQYMQQFGFIALAPPLDAWSLFRDMRITPIISDKDAGEFCNTVSSWAYAQDDPLALVVAWEVLLGEASGDEASTFFKSHDFRKLLDSLFLDITVPEYRSGNQKDNAKRNFYEKAWEARTHLAQHYLRYLELESINKTDDQRVLAAWWMAQKAIETLLESMGSMGNDERATLLEKSIIPDWITKATIHTYVQHSLFHFPKALQSPNRYCTFVVRRHLAAAMMAFVAPTNEGLPTPGYAGMTMTDEIRDGMIRLLESPADLALAHLPVEQHSTTVLLWNRALTQSVPLFLRSYYKENISLAGKRKMDLLQSAESISKADYPDEVLKELTKNINAALVFHAVLAFEIIGLKFVTEGTLTPALKTLLENLKTLLEKPKVLGELVALDESLGPLVAVSLVRILPFLYVRKEKSLAQEIEKQLLKMDWNLLRNCAAIIIEKVIFATLLGEDNNLFRKLLDTGHRNKEFHSSLEVMKENLGIYLDQVPASHRERVRYVLRELETIPETKPQ